MLTPPTVNFGTLEDLLEEIVSDRLTGKTIHSIRVTTDFRTRSGGGLIGEETTVSLIVTSCTSEVQGQVALFHYSVWSCRLARFAEVNGLQASSWSKAEVSALAGKVVEAAMAVIEQRTEIRPKAGMYCLADSDWLTIRGGTDLIDLRPMYEEIKPRLAEEKEA